MTPSYFVITAADGVLPWVCTPSAGAGGLIPRAARARSIADEIQSPGRAPTRTTMQLYAQSDQESRLEAQGKFLEVLLGDKAHLLTDTIQ